MSSSHTLAVIKPPHADKGHVVAEIIKRAANAGLHPTRMWMGMLSRQKWEAFYHVHRHKEFYPGLIEHMLSGYSVFMVLHGPDAIRVWRQTMEGIREDFSEGSPANAVHGSDSETAFQLECHLVFTGVP